MKQPAVTAVVLIATLALGACNNPNRYAKSGGVTSQGYNAGGAGYGAGGASNPASPEYFRATVGDTVWFPVDQSTLTDEARATLNGQASWLNQNVRYAAKVEGHADERGTREYNLALGARRANAVQEYLISRGVAGGRLSTVSYGKERPLAVCSDDEACFARNRRAQTVLSTALGS